MQIVTSRQQRLNRTLNRMHWLIIVLTALALAIVIIPTPPALAIPGSQNTTSKLNRHGGEESDWLLLQVERDIAANKFPRERVPPERIFERPS